GGGRQPRESCPGPGPRPNEARPGPPPPTPPGAPSPVVQERSLVLTQRAVPIGVIGSSQHAEPVRHGPDVHLSCPDGSYICSFESLAYVEELTPGCRRLKTKLFEHLHVVEHDVVALNERHPKGAAVEREVLAHFIIEPPGVDRGLPR